MGGSTFDGTHVGPDARTVFSEAHDQAAWDHGHGGYTGTLAEKHDYVTLPVPPLDDITIDEFVQTVLRGPGWDEGATWTIETWNGGKWESRPASDAVVPHLERAFKAVDDKWGPAGLIDITDTPDGQAVLARWLEHAKEYGRPYRQERDGTKTYSGPEPTLDGKRAFRIFGWASS